jgi:cell division protein FtsB
MYRLLALILVVLLVLLQMKLWQGEGSWTAEQALQRQVEDQRAENAKLKERNAALEAEVADLKTGETAVEERARSELGMIKPGETFYRVVEPADPKTNVRPEDVPEDAASPASPASSASSTSSMSSVTKTTQQATQAPKK